MRVEITIEIGVEVNDLAQLADVATMVDAAFGRVVSQLSETNFVAKETIEGGVTHLSLEH